MHAQNPPSLKPLLCSCLLILAKLAEECLPGCLKCTKDGQCLQCDFSSFFFPKDSQCQKKSLGACTWADPEGNCLRCNGTSFIRNNTCSEVAKAEAVAGCVEYISQVSCKTCGPGLLLEENRCLPANETISSCEVLLLKGRMCAKCAKGFVLAFDQRSCLKTPEAANCFSYTTLGCKQCKAGFFLSPQKYQIDVLKTTERGQKAYLGTFVRLMSYFSLGSFQTFEGSCIASSLQNCRELSDYDKCAKCEGNYYLTSDFKCQAFPKEPVPFCELYANSTTCLTCQNKFYMADLNSCAPVTEIENCELYSRTTDKACLGCVKTHYTDQTNCIPRVQSAAVANCKTLDDFADKCLFCAEAFEINFAGTTCLPATPFCLKYLKSNSQFNCTQCQDYYYLDGDKCLKSSAQNCRVVTGLETCAECENGYFLNATLCAPHPLRAALNCNATKSGSMNECVACAATHVAVSLDGMCSKVAAAINNCFVYGSPTACASCNRATSFFKDGTCQAAFIENCSELNGAPENSCKTCKVDFNNKIIYVPFPKAASLNKCVPGDPNIIENCLLYNTKDDAEYCSVCLTKYYQLTMPSANFLYCVPRNFYLLPTQAFLLTDCLVFNTTTGKCIVCAGSKVVGSDSLCTNECQPSEYLYAVAHGTQPLDVSFKSFMECSATNPSIPTATFFPAPLDCYLVVENASESELLCGGCAAGQIGAIDWARDLTKASALAYLPIPNTVVYSYYNRVTTFHKCLSRQVTYGGQTTAAETRVVKLEDGSLANLDNCRVLALVGASDRYGCAACRFGYSGVVVKDFDGSGYVIKKCEPIPLCRPAEYYRGLGSLANQLAATPASPPLDFFVSCHVCSDGKIPTFARTFEDLSDVTPNIKAGFFGNFTFPKVTDTALPYKNSTLNGAATSCQTPGLGKTFVAFCAVQEVAINRLLQNYAPASATNNPMCVACTEGYKATMQGSTRIVSACTKIENCLLESGKIFNKCAKCIKSFSLKYDPTAADGLTKYEECVPAPLEDPNCLIANVTATPSKCVVCQPGFTKNADGFCDAVFTFKCQAPGFYAPMAKKALRSLSFPYSGCRECGSDSIGIFFDTPKKICVLSTKLATASTALASGFLIENCQLFARNSLDAVVCHACDTDFVMSVSGQKCFRPEQRIKNCRAYTNDGLSCGQCLNGFFLNQVSNCVEGKIQNCEVYASERRCQACAAGFLAIEAEGSRRLCLEKPDLNCQEFDEGSLAVGLLSCKLCRANFYYEKNPAVIGKLPLFYCAPIPKIANCREYENQNDISSARLTCKVCEEGFFWNASQCLPRARAKIPSCLKLADHADACKTCEPGFTLESSGLCEPFPAGIFGCEGYKNNKLCQQCRPQMFLADNRCLQVPAESIISDCLYYDSQLRCLACRPKFFKASPVKCEEARARDCLTYTSRSVCASCPANYGIVRDQETTSCAPIAISNCVEPDYASEGPKFKCRLCATSFYLTEEKGCAAVPNIIDHCALYSSASECSICFNGYVLAPDNKVCLSDSSLIANSDINCVNSFVLQEPKCNVCEPGNYFGREEGAGDYACRACDPSLGKGCLLCDPQAVDKCILCSRGYFQTSDGSCQLSEAPTSPVVVQSDSGVGLGFLGFGLLGLLVINNL